ncbi:MULTISPECIES: asparagine synthase (glutamine-hydrolyzing) [unclassified Bradyrhizobium]|uniref:asparagine synthase (glutamine-hydrolyzing) n=1 Tax=unclassified Bradyrhizobium TaxID=2631580 RepID=UPI0021121010|nr:MULTISPECIES: asparagine synthase (glutamine-hydrolyzing) [unclassified Bradyrhizobium]MCK1535449.1 asparagine synthase (glutamine-hydrolyzing) [Bradyrhizobium sp. 176]MCK1558126.1 asparagine synthase (glutamine-hydrolyzing) [Bradyrhizobium sp. 171]
MCGIAGWIGPPADPGCLQTMTNTIRHRGPDGEGQVTLPLSGGAVAAMGHRRLSIIDISGGSQPMSSHDGRFTVVFNGEIYNYIEIREELLKGGARFTSSSDTEVILEAWRAWGAECLPRFRGMFAFVLHDGVTRTAVLARDQFGKKPLFLAERQTVSGPVLVFGSEIAALLTHPDVRAELDIDTLYQYLCWRYAPGPFTFFRNVRKLPPGSCLIWRNGEMTTRRYWTAPEETALHRAPPADPVAGFLAVFDEAVKLRLRADVPLGAFLSGGLDSTAIVATLAHLGAPEIRTFSVGFRDDPASELSSAAETAREIGTTHTSLELVPDDLTALLPMLSRHRAAPIAETADLPIYMMSVEAAKHVKVILSGEGSDEIFGGYPKHLVETHLGRLAGPGLLSVAGQALLAATAPAPAVGRRLRIAARAMSTRRFDERMISWFGALTTAERKALWTGPAVFRQPDARPFSAAAGSTPLRRVLHFDQTSWLPDNLLERMDMMTMAASIEARAPFMDVRLAEFASTLPDSHRIKGKVTKRIVRKALAPRLPQSVLTRRKNGFRMPVTEWFRGPLRDPARELLLGSDSISRPYLDRETVQLYLDEHAKGLQNHDKTLWALFALETFLREFF